MKRRKCLIAALVAVSMMTMPLAGCGPGNNTTSNDVNNAESQDAAN